ncbi:poly-gamma-glutamate synthase PgsB [Bacillus thuringiensis]|uniref:poly-gamma-glutamate synthase PgsB n=1 Tax=Bacillus thuringiensis TaxID=1428 RepID=UPI002E185C49|nr:poly-gamma-glutamate synthase PgsB [Bacillus thuringiensis]MEC5308362.1 poly-gamma-glutamate synthase PgsB [Bacillus thuringiensis]
MIFIIISCFVFLFTYGILEQIIHKKRLSLIPIRINVNGIRGKSTVTRLITGIMKEANYKIVGKTTGTSARMIYWFKNEEKSIIRRKEGPNIGEQRRIVKEVTTIKAEALVCECMAVQPEYQETFQTKMLDANIGVIVNVLEDHMDVMGPTLDQVADAFISTIPYNGYLVTIHNKYLDLFQSIAKDRNTKVIIADNKSITDEFLKKFEYLVFPDNAAIALAVAEALNIDKKIAYQGMLNAQPDPGATRIIKFGEVQNPTIFVNGFAANDTVSTLNIWRKIESFDYTRLSPIIIMNCREDRVDRTEQFIYNVLSIINSELIITIGKITSPVKAAYKKGELATKNLIDLEGASTIQILEQIRPYIKGRIVYGIGNIHGAAMPLIDKIMEEKINDINNSEKNGGI